MPVDPRSRGGCALALAALVALLLVIMGWLRANETLFAPNSLPWKPVVLDAQPRWLAHWQMARLHRDRQACRTALSGARRLAFSSLVDRPAKEGCGFDNVVRTLQSPVPFAPKVMATCAMTAGLYWYQNQLQTAAIRILGTRLTGVTQLGTFSCRNVNNQVDGRRSQHATANAIDIAGFRFADGRRILVARNYGSLTPDGRFLNAAHDEACKIFGVVLGPKYNRLHSDHFHLDMSGFGFGLCA